MHTLILGGAKSGKSSFALSLGHRIIKMDSGTGNDTRGLFIATAQAHDVEMQDRIQRHREERGDEWETVEEPVDVVRVLKSKQEAYSVLLIDCLTLWLANTMHQYPDNIEQHCRDLAHALREICTPVIMVSNEVGSGIVPMSAEARAFRDHAGRLHQNIARECTRVILTVAGIPMFVKGEDIA